MTDDATEELGSRVYVCCGPDDVGGDDEVAATLDEAGGVRRVLLCVRVCASASSAR